MKIKINSCISDEYLFIFFISVRAGLFEKAKRFKSALLFTNLIIILCRDTMCHFVITKCYKKKMTQCVSA